MPKVKCYSAAWLSAKAPGHQLFEPSSDSSRLPSLSPSLLAKSARKTLSGPRRTIARRGTEVFVAVGREIRWADLAYLKDDWYSKLSSPDSDDGVRIKRESSLPSILDDHQGHPPHGSPNATAPGFRRLRTSVADDIRQLIISPNSDYLAILTTHTVHICLLPNSSNLTSDDTSPLRPRIYTLGPTTHVTSRSRLVSALWHPLGVLGSCIVTITADAIVRVWELSTEDRWSFDAPTTSIDLKKLADGRTLDQDYSASSHVTNKVFSPDFFEMEVASASFASRGSGGWSPMTLWIAMRTGDVYALCPLLPQRWAPPPTLIPSLSVSIVTTVASIEDDVNVDDAAKRLAQQQLQWMGDVDAQEPQVLDTLPGESAVEIYTRPGRPGAVPRLQGPFYLAAEPESCDDLDATITDILVIGKKTDLGDLMMGEDELLELGDGDQEGLSLTVICLLSTSGQVRVYLDLEGVQAQWLPPRGKQIRGSPAPPLPPLPADRPSLLTFQALDTMSPIEVSEESWPMFSVDVMSRYNFFVTHHAGLVYVSLAPWIFRLEGELVGDKDSGTDFRMNLLVNSQSVREKVYAQPTPDPDAPLAAGVAICDPDLGYFLLSSASNEPIALTFDTPDVKRLSPISHDESTPPQEPEPSTAVVAPPLDFYQPRPVFRPPHAFDQSSALPMLLERLRTSRYKTTVCQEVKLSPMTLRLFTEAHRILGDETYKLGVAAAEVFRRCELLQAELQQQIIKANEVKGKIEAIAGTGRDDGEADKEIFERRLDEARNRQEKMKQRVEKLRRLVGRATTRDLSLKEQAFADEVKEMEISLSGPDTKDDDDEASHGKEMKPLWERLAAARNLQAELLFEAEALSRSAGDAAATPNLPRIPSDIRQSKFKEVQGLLSRETALVEAVTSRLKQLQTSV